MGRKGRVLKINYLNTPKSLQKNKNENGASIKVHFWVVYLLTKQRNSFADGALITFDLAAKV